MISGGSLLLLKYIIFFVKYWISSKCCQSTLQPQSVMEPDTSLFYLSFSRVLSIFEQLFISSLQH
jgi:hypothetical protein